MSSCRWRAAIALILMLALPLRTIAASTMPCCPPTADVSHASVDHHAMNATMGETDGAMDDAGVASAATAAHHDDTRPTFDCCAIAMIALPIRPVVAARYVPPQALAMRPPSVAHFVTDAPDRPPRAATLMV